ncbi:MAG: hypothetical protein FWD31_15380, partial [Planctomycetaceae bacterium]|nr:hypothetical protein [Planctomycetaceae bacterium]
MRLPHFLLCLTLVMLTALSTFAQKPPLPSMVIPDGLGYNIHFTDARPGELEMLAESGATIVRMDFFWAGTEREKGVYDFSAFERLTDSLEKHKIRPLYILDYSNRHYDNNLSPYTAEGRAAFAKWAAAAAVHFKDRGILWEMYNEPNISFWKPEPKPDDYILLALEVGRALREAAPNELYIGPATSEIDFDFLEKCFKAGLLEYWDAVSVHPYRQRAPETVVSEYAKLRWMIDKYASDCCAGGTKGKHIPILSAEWGYSSVWGGYNDEIQGKMLPRQWLINLACDVPISIWYDWHDDGRDPQEPEHHFGTTNFQYYRDRTPVYDPKPSYIAAKTFTETFKGFKYSKRLFGGNPEEMSDNSYVFLFAKEDDVRLAVWTTEKEPQTITIPCPGTFKAISYLGEELPDIFAEDHGLTLTVTDGPIYLIPKKPNDALTAATKWETEPLVVYRSNASRTVESSMAVSTLSCNELEFTQRTVVFPTAPLIVRTPMIEGDELVIQIDNPSGERFVGSIHPKAAAGIALSPLYRQPKRILIENGELYHIERFKIVARQGNCYSLSVDLYNYDAGRTATAFRETALSQQGICPIDDFAKYDTNTLDANWGIFPDGDRNVESEQTLAVGENGSLSVTYRFGEGWKFLRLAPKNAELAKIEGQPQSLAVRVKADGSGNTIRLRYSDSQGQTFQVNGERMTEAGMQLFSFDLTGKEATSHWGGPNDGVIHYPIAFDSLIIDGT